MIVWKTKGNSCNVQVTEKRFVVFNITLKVNKLYPFNLYLTINYSYFYLISGMFGIVQLMFWYIKNKNNWQREDKLPFLLCFTWIYFKNITKTNLLLYIYPYLSNQTCFYFICLFYSKSLSKHDFYLRSNTWVFFILKKMDKKKKEKQLSNLSITI